MGKTKILVSGTNLDLLNKSIKNPLLSVLRERAEMQSSVAAACCGCAVRRNAFIIKGPRLKVNKACQLMIGRAS